MLDPVPLFYIYAKMKLLLESYFKSIIIYTYRMTSRDSGHVFDLEFCTIPIYYIFKVS